MKGLLEAFRFRFNASAFSVLTGASELRGKKKTKPY
jgi:hypothetical protein